MVLPMNGVRPRPAADDDLEADLAGAVAMQAQRRCRAPHGGAVVRRRR